MTAAPTGAWTTGVLREVTRSGTGLVRMRLEVKDRIDHWPGQHYVVRLRAPDGYTAQRSYSIASDPADPLLELLVEWLPRGEVSTHFHDVAEVGDEFELRGPIGGYFVWTGDVPALAVGGGSGVVPLVSMLRHARRTGTADLLRVAVAAQTRDKLPYADELEEAGAFIALTRENTSAGRVAAHLYPDELEALAASLPGGHAERSFVCGSVGFAGFVGRILGEAGIRADTVRVEQFGATT